MESLLLQDERTLLVLFDRTMMTRISLVGHQEHPSNALAKTKSLLPQDERKLLELFEWTMMTLVGHQEHPSNALAKTKSLLLQDERKLLGPFDRTMMQLPQQDHPGLFQVPKPLVVCSASNRLAQSWSEAVRTRRLWVNPHSTWLWMMIQLAWS
jgi:hypothetical protein